MHAHALFHRLFPEGNLKKRVKGSLPMVTSGQEQFVFYSALKTCPLPSLLIMHKSQIHKLYLTHAWLFQVFQGISLFIGSAKAGAWIERETMHEHIHPPPKGFLLLCKKKSKAHYSLGISTKCTGKDCCSMPTALWHKAFLLKHHTVEDLLCVLLF